jgi:hypothetical protein
MVLSQFEMTASDRPGHCWRRARTSNNCRNQVSERVRATVRFCILSDVGGNLLGAFEIGQSSVTPDLFQRLLHEILLNSLILHDR